MSVGTYASEEEPYAPECADLLLIVGAPVVNLKYEACCSFSAGLRASLFLSDRSIRLSGKTSEKCFPSARVISSVLIRRAFEGSRSKPLYIVFAYIVIEAVVLAGIDRVKLIYLYKMKSLSAMAYHSGTGRYPPLSSSPRVYPSYLAGTVSTL